ncbi:MAG TPA: hypothetical protein VFG10_11950 [Saprospiraceae bacterium]|nr:hypothetical protein [Saprospiraceae bacterium]
MSKKKQKPVTTPKKTSAPERAVKTTAVKERRPEFELIRFDLKAWVFIGACIFFFILFVALKWHNSSIPRWNQMVPDGGDQKRGLVYGEPLFIRSDEWLVTTPFILAQEENNFPVTNEALGYGTTPLTFGFPTNHILSYVKPAFWGYFLLDAERAFSWHWNFRIFPFLIASFLMLMLFTRNNFWLSLFGSLWLLLSSAVQWWSINTELFTYGFACVISFIYMLYSDKLKSIITAGILFAIAGYSFALVLYLAYLVPFAYFLLALLIGYMLKNKTATSLIFKKDLPLKILTFGLSMVFLGGLIFYFYHLSKDTVSVMANTVYPGQRAETGGGYPFVKLFTDNFNFYLGLNKYPANWGNICEASAFLMLSPIASIVIVADWIKSKKADPLLISVMVFQIIALTWILFGFPLILAKISLFSASPSYRAVFIFGFANVIATLLFLSHFKGNILKNTWPVKILSFVVLFGLAYGLNYLINKQATSFFTPDQVLKATLIFAVLNWLVLFYKNNKWQQVAFFAGCALVFLPNAKINPLSKGLSPFYENAIFKAVSAINKQDPGKGWVVFGAFTYGDFLKAAGIKCFNGVQIVPPMDKLKILDPEMKSDSIYNRYAHIDVLPYISEDSVKFSLIQNDRYSIRMDPCSPKLTEMGIEYILFTYQPQPVEVDCMTFVYNTLNAYVYKRNPS